MGHDFDASKLAQELRDTWQCRALVATRRRELSMVIDSMLERTYELTTLETFRRAAFGLAFLIPYPMLHSYGRIDKTGAVVADQIDRFGRVKKDVAIFQSTEDMQRQFRRLADELKLPDDQRIEMFNVLQRWIVADRRIDPTMNPLDPEARRLVLH